MARGIKRRRERIAKVLSEGPRTTREVMSLLLDRWPKMNVSSYSISQTLARYPEFTEVGETILRSQLDSRYKTKVWGLTEKAD